MSEEPIRQKPQPGGISGDALMLNMAVLSGLLPIILFVSVAVFFPWDTQQPTLSDYVYTTAHPFFYGIVFALGFILFAYRGYPTSTSRIPLSDNQLASLAGLGAIMVAIFPTSHCASPDGTLSNLFRAPIWPIVHILGAALCYASMAVFFLFFFTQSGGKPDVDLSKAKRLRNRIYRSCGVTILVVMTILLAITLYKIFGDTDECADAGRLSIVFWLETVMQFSIAIAWGTKYYSRTLSEERLTPVEE